MIKVRHIAQVCREAMVEFSAAFGITAPHWDDLTDRQRRMSTFIVNYIQSQHDSVVTPEAVHNAWMGEMIHNEGFHYGVDAFDEKAHPNLVAWNALPTSVQITYALTIGIVRGMRDIGDRYEVCAPIQNVVLGALAPEKPTMSESELTRTIERLGGECAPPTDGGLSVEEISALREGGPSDVHFTGHTMLVSENAQAGPSEHEEVR